MLPSSDCMPDFPSSSVQHKLDVGGSLTMLVAQAGTLLDSQYVDPYSAEAYDIQQRKWDCKLQREDDRKSRTAARASIVTA